MMIHVIRETDHHLYTPFHTCHSCDHQPIVSEYDSEYLNQCQDELGLGESIKYSRLPNLWRHEQNNVERHQLNLRFYKIQLVYRPAHIFLLDEKSCCTLYHTCCTATLKVC